MIKSLKLSENEISELSNISRKMRRNILLMIHNAKSGHPGGSLSTVEIMTTLYLKCLNHDKNWIGTSKWEDRDRFVLSKGHASAALYAVLAETGYISEKELLTFRCFKSRLQGHPSCRALPGVEVSTGSLGQGLSIANGIALGLKLDKKPSRVYVLLGDGEVQEGQVWEAAMTSAHYKLSNLTAIIDRNNLQIDGSTESIKSINPLDKKWEAFGWQVLEVDGHNHQEIYDAIQKSIIIGQEKSAPVMIIANTVKGKGVSFMENNCGWHGKAPNDDELKTALEELRG